ncbi:cupin domain-containing protein [Muriicola sp.]|uniref:cupin domain-containing protein n=1 Tax=Muriicola sp. TaxID=2020856 RepID=UPI003567B44B
MRTIYKGFKELEYQGLKIDKMVSSASWEILGIALEAGKVFPEHISPRDAHLIMLEGSIDFSIEGNTFRIQEQEYFNFPKKTKHIVRALKNSKFIIVR